MMAAIAIVIAVENKLLDGNSNVEIFTKVIKSNKSKFSLIL